MEFVEASERHDEFVLGKFRHTNGALAFTIFLGFLRVISLVASPGQLRENSCADGLLVVAHVQLIHVVLELLLAHVVHSLVHPVLKVATVMSPRTSSHENVLAAKGRPHHIHESPHLLACQLVASETLGKQVIRDLVVV